jgi:plastocyanin
MKRDRAVAAAVLSIALAAAAMACGGSGSGSTATAGLSSTPATVASPPAAAASPTTVAASATPAAAPSAAAPTAAPTSVPVATEGPATRPAVVATEAPPPPPPSAQSVTVVARDTKYSPTQLTLPAGASITLTLDNQDVGAAHDIVVYDPANVRIAGTEVAIGPVTSNVTFTLEGPGLYRYGCSVHPQQMRGTISVQ